MKEITKEIKDYLLSVGYPNKEKIFYLEVWLWLWREKGIRFNVEDLWDANLSYTERGCACNTNQLGGICTPEVSDPEEAIIAAIEYLVTNKLLK